MEPPDSPEAGRDDQLESPWALPEPEPTTVIALWPGADAPTCTEVTAALEGGGPGPIEVIDELEQEDPEVLWNVVVQAAQLSAPVIIWAEPASPMAPGELEDEAAEACRWVVGAETVLDSEDPLDDFLALVQLIAGRLEESPALLDVNGAMWYRRHELEQTFLTDGLEPPADVLWVIHIVGRDRDEDGYWLHTHGLARCGLPELEMIEVPRDHVATAAQLLQELGARILEWPLPSPEERFEVGNDLVVVARPYEPIAAELPDDTPGSIARRENAGWEEHAGVRAVICADPATSGAGPLWAWPADVIRRIEREDATLYRSIRATERLARLARGTWDELATAFAACRHAIQSDAEDPPVLFLLKCGFDRVGVEESGREHLWFKTRRIDGDRAEGELLNQPIAVPHLEKGDVTWIDRQGVTEWQVLTPAGTFGPSEIGSLWRAIDEVNGAFGSES